MSNFSNKAIFPALLCLTLSVGPAFGEVVYETYKKPLSGPQLGSPVHGFVKNSQTGHDAFQNFKPLSSTKEKPDAAFGAFQRGYYLTALDLALPRAESGDPAAQTLIAEIYWHGHGVGIDKEKAITWYRFAADGGNREAQFTFGNLLLRGVDGVKQDKKQGEDYLRKAALAGHGRAAFNIAQIITAKRPTYAAFKRAFPWYKKSAEAGIADAQYALANIHAEAKGVPVNDLKLAREWMAKAAEGGLDTAQVDYAIWLANGKGGKKDHKAALYWLKRAVTQFNVVAQNRLARAYAFGIGTDIDMVKAGGWHIIAQRAGVKDTEMDRLFQSLPEIDRKRALEFANRLKKG